MTRHSPAGRPWRESQSRRNFSTAELADRLRDFEGHFAKITKPFEWTFTRDDLANLLKRLDPPSLAHAA